MGGQVQKVGLGPADLARVLEELGIAEREHRLVADQPEQREVGLQVGHVLAPAQDEHGHDLTIQDQRQGGGVADLGQGRVQRRRQAGEVEPAAEHRPARGDRLLHERLKGDRVPVADEVRTPRDVEEVLHHRLPTVDAEEDAAVGAHRLHGPPDRPPDHLARVERR